jgi:ABC-type glycerol-3-phosphate transport system permease component
MIQKKSKIQPVGILSGSVKQLFLILASLVAAYPIYYMAVTALKTRQDWLDNQFGLPHILNWANFNQALDQGKLFIWFRNSVIVTLAAILLSTLVAALAAYAITRMRFRGRDTFLNSMIALMVVPPAVLILPLFVLMVSFFSGLPSELFDAAAIDGSSNFGTLWRIVIPLSTPALITLVIVNALWVWNELLVALVFLQSEDLKTLMPGLTLFKGHFTINEPLIMAGTLIATLPMILLYLFGQRFFVEGMVAGAVK